MLASPSFTSGKKRRKEPKTRRRIQDETEDDDQPTEDDDQQGHHRYGECEALGCGVKVSQFPLVVKYEVKRPHSSVLAIAALERANLLGASRSQGQCPLVLENITHGQLQAVSTMPADNLVFYQEGSEGGDSVYVLTPPPILQGHGVIKQFGDRIYVVPMHADWFSPTGVHRLERQVVPHFFSRKSPDFALEKYIAFRNKVVSKYIENPEKNLEVSDCQALVVGMDIEDVKRIVRFLDQWGIINYCSAVQSCITFNGDYSLYEDSNGEIRVPSDALKSLDSLIKFDKPKCRLKAADAYSSLQCPDEDASDLDSQIREQLSEYYCHICSQPLPVVYYQSQKEVDVLLCSDCFHEGRFVIGHSSIDFIKMDLTNESDELDAESWTDQETLLLLEALEIYNDNWNAVADHVGTKTKSQCILHFIRLPVEEAIIENVEAPSMPLLSNTSNKPDIRSLCLSSDGDLAGARIQDSNSEGRLPFANSENPVMALVAFLASAVGPRVAAACAQASLAALSAENDLDAPGSILQMEEHGYSKRIHAEELDNRDNSSYAETAGSSQQKVNGLWGQNVATNAPVSTERINAAAKAGLAAAAIKAKLFANHEEREIQWLSANIINHQLKRVELKLKQLEEVDALLIKESEQVEWARQRLYAERARITSTQFRRPGVTSPMSLLSFAPAMVNSNLAQASPSLSSISRHGIPTGHNVSFMPQPQSMFGLGQRMPFVPVQASSSVPPDPMLNSPANAMCHPWRMTGTNSDLG